jgi:hypothetical protein
MLKYLILMASAFEPDHSYYGEYEIKEVSRQSFYSPRRKLTSYQGDFGYMEYWRCSTTQASICKDDGASAGVGYYCENCNVGSGYGRSCPMTGESHSACDADSTVDCLSGANTPVAIAHANPFVLIGTGGSANARVEVTFTMSDLFTATTDCPIQHCWT